jgi:hypothetical protein
VLSYLKMSLLCTAAVFSTAARAQDRGDQGNKRQEAAHYEDSAHHDSHEWNDKESQSWQRYLQEHHKKTHDFAKANKREQQDYWNWRHAHPDEERH